MTTQVDLGYGKLMGMVRLRNLANTVGDCFIVFSWGSAHD